MQPPYIPYETKPWKEPHKIIHSYGIDPYKLETKLKQGYFLNKNMRLVHMFNPISMETGTTYHFSKNDIRLIFNSKTNNISIFKIEKDVEINLFLGYIETEEEFEKLVKQLRIIL